MKKLLWLALLLAATSALAQETAPETLLQVGERTYALGVSTVLDFADGGWTYTVEGDGAFAFFSPENESWFYARTAGGAPEEPVVFIDLTAADGVPVRYAGYSGVEDAGAFWAWLQDAYQAEENEEGTLTAVIPLADADALRVETKGVRFCLMLEQGTDER